MRGEELGGSNSLNQAMNASLAGVIKLTDHRSMMALKRVI